ncbi:uncharacterized protein LOC123519291 isoform X4 [Portunus trituberculatus]|uniref:uncharacterized protein LOC123519291 isoform X4 n=1 Tax=Portunus trituberculatus TaxID=210409 RepID=UPI001E1CB9B9|nr:uncharacterized protein LOC123519291 isoform X4 [Portunus trituberculatus]
MVRMMELPAEERRRGERTYVSSRESLRRSITPEEAGRKLQATVAMKEAWEESRLSRSSRAQAEDNDGCCCDASCCCCCCPTECSIFIKYIVCRALGLFLYVMDIVTDITVSVADYRNGEITFAAINLGLVFTPGFLYVMFALTEMLSSNTGMLACSKAVLWFLSFPILPLWPIFRDLQKIYHGFLALFPSRRQEQMVHLNRPTRSYLLKFLEAFTEAAPQILLRLYKISLRRQELPFSQIETMEVVQVSFSLLTLASKVISTYQKSVTTQQVIDGELEDNEKFTLPCCVQVATWFPYTVYTVLVFIENSIMLVVWFSSQKAFTSTLPEEEQVLYATHRERLIFVHYGAFCCGLIMMIATFCCPERKRSVKDKEVTEEMRHMSVAAS